MQDCSAAPVSCWSGISGFGSVDFSHVFLVAVFDSWYILPVCLVALRFVPMSCILSCNLKTYFIENMVSYNEHNQSARNALSVERIAWEEDFVANECFFWLHVH